MKKVTFLYEGPHAIHRAWADSVNSYFLPNFGAGYKKGSNIFSKFFRLFLAPIKLSKIPKETEVLLIEGGLGFFTGFLFKKFRRKKVVLIVSDPVLKLFKEKKFIGKIGYSLIKDFDGFIPTSSLMSSYVPFKKKAVIYPFFDVDKFRKNKADLNSKNFIYVGVLNQQKGVDKIVDLFKRVNDKIPESKLFLVGDGPLKKEIEKINDKNIILTGFTKSPERYMKESLFYLNLSRFDPFGMVLLEMMSVGLIPIISKNVGASDVLKEVDESLIVENEREAYERIMDLMRNKRKIQSISKRCRKASQEYCEKNSVKEFKKAFYSFIK